MTPRRITVLVLIVLALIVAAINFDRVIINLLFFKISIPLVVLILITLIIGFIVGYLSRQSNSELVDKKLQKVEHPQNTEEPMEDSHSVT